MSARLRIRFFVHSLVSDWCHGSAHFLRGLARDLVRSGHDVRCYEELGSWAVSHLVQKEEEAAIPAIDDFRLSFPELDIHFYQNDATFPEFAARELRGADVVILHEWNHPSVVNAVLSLKRALGFRALFHDTHHRAYSSPRDILRFHLHLFDGVLAAGHAITRIYAEGFGVPRVWNFHEAADVEHFRPLPSVKTSDVVWLGDWGDDEDAPELEEFLLAPARALHAHFVAYGVRYPNSALRKVEEAGIAFGGYLPSLAAPAAYAQNRVALHVPRRHYANGLGSVPGIRVFEALACGVPLLCAPWSDAEGLFRAGEDFLIAPNARAMAEGLEHLLRDDAARAQLAANGLAAIHRGHTSAHRARELLSICEEIGIPG